jgi:hypothetical protein
MKKLLLPGVLIAAFVGSAHAVTVKTSIDVQAEVASSVRVFVEGTDVTNGSIAVTLTNTNGYMYGVTPPFQFIGNASSVSLTLQKPSNGGLISENGDIMKIDADWLRLNGALVSAAYPINNLPVYATIQDIPDPTVGVKVNFKSADRTETYPLGSYSGTYVIVVTPSV